MIANLILIVCVFTISYFVARRCTNKKSSLYIVDVPNNRSLHTNPTPKSGGIAIVGSIIFGWIVIALYYNTDYSMITLSGVLIFLAVIGLIDSLASLSPMLRLVVHVLSALFVVATVGMIEFFSVSYSWINAGLTLLLIVWFINLYNFMDGMDGFASGMAIAGFGTIAYILYGSGNDQHALYALIVSIATFGFIIFNFPPARLFMGDSGSIPIGFMLAYFAVWGHYSGLLPIWIISMIFAPFLLDSTITLIKRLIKGQKIWQAHKMHYYQQIVQFGWTHKKTLMLEYVLMLVSCVFAIVAVNLSQTIQMLLTGFVFLFNYLVLSQVTQRLKSGTMQIIK